MTGKEKNVLHTCKATSHAYASGKHSAVWETWLRYHQYLKSRYIYSLSLNFLKTIKKNSLIHSENISN